MFDWFIIDGINAIMQTCPCIIYPFEILLLEILFDWAFGILGACKRGRLKSESMRAGLYRKIGELLLIGFLFLVVMIAVMSWQIVNVILIALLVKESLSLVENCLVLGVPIPYSIFKFLDVTSRKFDSANIEVSKKGFVKLKFKEEDE